MQHFIAQGWRSSLTHGRQLSGIAYEQQAAVSATIDILHQVIQQATAAKHALKSTLVGNHRTLVDHEKGVGMQIVIELEMPSSTHKGTLTIDLAVDGKRRQTAVYRQHLGRTTGGCQQHHLLPQSCQGLDNSGRHRSLARTCRPTQHHYRPLSAVGEETGKDLQGMGLVVRGDKTQHLLHLINKLLLRHRE